MIEHHITTRYQQGDLLQPIIARSQPLEMRMKLRVERIEITIAPSKTAIFYWCRAMNAKTWSGVGQISCGGQLLCGWTSWGESEVEAWNDGN